MGKRILSTRLELLTASCSAHNLSSHCRAVEAPRASQWALLMNLSDPDRPALEQATRVDGHYHFVQAALLPLLEEGPASRHQHSHRGGLSASNLLVKVSCLQ